MDESLKKRILEAIGNDAVMPAVLSGLMERAGAELCALITARETELLYILAESRDLAQHVPEIREKLKNTYRMFAGGRALSRPAAIEKIFFRRNGITGAGGPGGSRIESYFLVPVAHGPRVTGVLFIGSIRKEAFARRDIALFHGLADEREERTPLVFQIGGEKEMLERLLAALPSGAALFAPDGRLVCANRAFRELMSMDDDSRGSVHDIARDSCFNIHGVWEEFNILQSSIVDRELEGSCVPERYLNVSWVLLDSISPEVGSLALLREITSQREQAEAREEDVAIVAHELRTPLAALKASLAIVQGAEEAGDGRPGGRRTGPDFLSNAVRTVDRLGRLVDGLVDASSARLDERPFRIESHDTKKFLEEVTMLFVHPMEKRGIDFSIDIDDACRTLMFDRDRIEQVVHNLLANSMKHVPGGGSISISIRPAGGCPARILPAGLAERLPSIAFADLAVRDSGSGIPREIAEMSNRAESAERPVRASRGLGLVIAKRLVRMQGGALVIDGRVGQGSAVHLYLPVDQNTARIVKRYRLMQMKVEELTAKGFSSAVYVVSKEEAMPWDEVAERCRPTPVINPEAREMGDHDAFLWSLSGRIGLALVARLDRREDPVAFLDGEPRIGWAVSPREGAGLRDLVSAALDRMQEGPTARTLKGVA
jgi:signal transduction histidine kinase